MLGFFLLTLSSMSSQMLITYLHIPLPLIGIAQALALLGFVSAGNHFGFLRTNFGPLYVALAVWWVLVSLVGIYPRGSLSELLPYLIRLHILPFLFVAIASSAYRVRFLMTCFAWGYLMVIVYCFLFGSANNSDARFIIDKTSLGNPNDLALHLLLGASFAIVLFRNRLTAFLAILAMPCFAYYVLKTSSRSNFIAVGLIVVISCFILPAAQRRRLIAISAIGFFLIIPLVPRTTWLRLFTFTEVDYSDVNSASDAENARHAADSTKARTELQRRAVLLTLEHPLFGVGPKNFADAVDKMMRGMTGKKSTWQGAHNTYLQVASESGIPGMLIYASCIFLLVRTNLRCFKLTLRYEALSEFSVSTFALTVASIVFSWDLFFAHIAYDYHLPVLMGFTAANEIGLRRIVASLAARPAAKPAVAASRRFAQALRPAPPVPAAPSPRWNPS